MKQFNKFFKKYVVTGGLLLLSLINAREAKAQVEPVKILFLGNSFTAANNTPELVRQFAESAGIPVLIDARTPGGCYVKYVPQGEFAHANNPEVYEKIRSIKWDYLVIQDNQGFFCGPVIGSFHPDGKVIEGHAQLRDSLLKINPCGKVILFAGWLDADPMTWAPELGLADAQEANIRVFNQYKFLNDSIHQIIAPIGLAWNYVLDSLPGVELFAADNSHPTYEGSYLTAATIFTSIFRVNTEDVSFNGTLSPVLAEKMKEFAYKTVKENADATLLSESAPMLTVADGALIAPEGYADHRWYKDGVIDMSLVGPAIPAMPFTCYQLLAKDAQGCDRLSLEYCFDAEVTGMGKLSLPENIKIYPNPVTDYFTIDQKDDQLMHTTAILTDIAGKIMQHIYIDSRTLQINMSPYTPGIYLLKLPGGYTMKVVKQ